MNRKLLEMLEKINAQKKTVQDLVDAGKLDEATEAKAELVKMQTAFDLVKDIEDAEPVQTGKKVKVAHKKDAISRFADAARRMFKNDGDDPAPADDPVDEGYAGNQEGVDKDGGYTVPEDISTRIERWREDHVSLASLVATENVKTMSGRRTYQKRASHTGFSKVAEGGKIGKVAGPEFEVVTYKIDKYAGALPVTDELLEDSDANIAGTLIEWLGEESVATRNNLILAKIAEKTVTAIAGIDDIKKAVNVTLGQKFAGLVSIVTNDDGLNYLDTLKDENGRYLLQPEVDPAKPMQMNLCVGARKIPVVVVPNEVFATDETNGIPFVVGSLKDYAKIFDRKRITIKASDIGTIGDLNAYEQDLTIFRAIERLDVEVLDTDAIVNGYLPVE